MHDYCQYDLDLKLMKAVKKQPVLYDTNVPSNSDFNAREVVWHKIGDELSRPASECKARWSCIRDIYRRSLRKNGNPYKYKPYLSFLNPFLKLSGLDINPGSDDNQDNDDDYKNDDNDFKDESDEEEKPTVKAIKLKRKSSTPGRSKIKSKKVVVETPEPAFADADAPEDDSTDVFLRTIGATLKTFSPYHLNVAKSKIFAIVQEHELQQIITNPGTSDDALGDVE